MKEYYKIGRIVATHGVTGQLVLSHSLGKKTALEHLEVVFVQVPGETFLPYFLAEASAKNHSETFLVLDGVATKEEASALLKKDIWLKKDDFEKLVSAAAAISLLGYIIVNRKEEVGEIIEVIEQTHQILCKVMLGNKEALIPVHEDLIIRRDQKNRRLYIEIPEGLLDIYREI